MVSMAIEECTSVATLLADYIDIDKIQEVHATQGNCEDYFDLQKQLNTSFVFKGLPSIEIKNGEKSLQASVVNKQEKDHAYVFTQAHDELKVGDVWTAKNLHLLIAEEITIIEDVNWRKYYA
jgi:hypothetical protein